MIPKSRIAHFKDEGLKIQDLQSRNKLRQLTLNTNDHDLAVKRKEISLRTSKLAARIEKWRKIQKKLMPRTGDKIAVQAILSLPIQNEKLFLPSDFTSEVEREALSLTGFAAEEIRWREGQVFDSLQLIQDIVKTISALHGRKIKNDQQQKQNTRAGDNIKEAIKLRDQHMESYERARQALSALNAPSTYPLLTEADLYMKPILQKRRVGDSWHTDGALWRIHGLIQSQDSGEKDQCSATNDHKNKATHTKAKSAQPQKKVVDERPEGWLWHLGRLSKMSDTEIDEWSNEGEALTFRVLNVLNLTTPQGDRVQWFRAEAEMQRWQEQGEQKLAELLRTNHSFLKMEDTWTALALQNAQTKPEHSAYAKQKAVMYRKRAEMAQALILGVGYGGDLLASDASLVQRVQEERDAERKFLVEALNIS
ncbi:hypothetical protein DFH08DRAFT_825113 [Mycena albidolilacea]|uniref:Uncharacterized protein n=1 Tax=Mycena albidolilacea TaxID=1033008 RepID=A0AAD6Z386_9AGAR|nr:hypothetical protein DFH08DRAFT_825113 [Mycena albidolilacea]